jgi:hypothetical protein
MRIKVQCISTNSGFYKDLERGKWYDAKIHKNYGSGEKLDEDLLVVYGTNDNSPRLYYKKLFRTLDEKREFRLNKILK